MGWSVMGFSNPIKLPEKLLLEKAKAGDNQALSLLLQDNYELIFGYFLKLTASKDCAFDLTQETLLKAIEKLGFFKGEAKLSTWLIAIGTNIYRDWLKEEKREWENQLKTVETEKALETDLHFYQLLEGLSPEKRLPLILKYYYGYTYEEIALLLDVPPGTVRSRLHYAISKLRGSLKQRGD